MRYAIVSDGIVADVVEWDGATPWTPPDGTTLQQLGDSPAGSGWTFDGSAFAPPEPVVSPPRPLTPREFMDRFTDDELDGIQLAVLNGEGMVQIVAMRAQRRLFTQLEVRLDHPDTLTLLGALSQVGLLAAERIPQILEPA